MNLNTLFSNIATAIRNVGGTSEQIKATDFPSAISTLSTSTGKRAVYSGVEYKAGASLGQGTIVVAELYTNFIIFLAQDNADNTNFTVRQSCMTFNVPSVTTPYTWIYYENKWRVVNAENLYTVSGGTITFNNTDALISSSSGFKYYIVTWE